MNHPTPPLHVEKSVLLQISWLFILQCLQIFLFSHFLSSSPSLFPSFSFFLLLFFFPSFFLFSLFDLLKWNYLMIKPSAIGYVWDNLLPLSKFPCFVSEIDGDQLVTVDFSTLYFFVFPFSNFKTSIKSSASICWLLFSFYNHNFPPSKKKNGWRHTRSRLHSNWSIFWGFTGSSDLNNLVRV